MADIFAWGFSSKENEVLIYTLESFTSLNIQLTQSVQQDCSRPIWKPKEVVVVGEGVWHADANTGIEIIIKAD